MSSGGAHDVAAPEELPAWGRGCDYRQEDHLDNLSYFVEWGGKSWQRLTKMAIHELQCREQLKNAQILEIGTRYGKMAVLFSLLGARVTALDISAAALDIARREAANWGRTDIEFIAYDGDLDIVADDSFDVVFTKSVLVVVPQLQAFLHKLSCKLKPGGSVVFLENARGNGLLHALRRLRHRKWEFQRANYFTDREIGLIGSIFQVDRVIKVAFPPAYLLIARKRQ